MPVVVIQVIGGILVALTMASSGVANINKQIQQRNQIVNEQIQDELDELKDDYSYCEEVHFKNLISDGEITEELSEEDYDEYRYEFAETYIDNYQDRINIEDKTFEHMKKQLPEITQKKLNQRKEWGGMENDKFILYHWIRYKIHGKVI